MNRSSAADVRKERRKSLYLREVTALMQDLAGKEPSIADVYVSHVDISPNSGILYIYFSAFKEPGEEIFIKALSYLKLYKPSLRKAFAQRIQTRYAPDLTFVFDKNKEKERRINSLLDKASDELNENKFVDHVSDDD